MLINAIIFLSSLLITIGLFRFYKSLEIKKNIVKPDGKEDLCDFKFTRTHYKKCKGIACAKFKIKLSEKNQFFNKIPLVFRFDSDNRFKAKIVIYYQSLKTGRYAEKIIDKTIVFETTQLEHIHELDDIIVGEILITIEMDLEYGDPIIEMIIQGNKKRSVTKNYRKIVRFPRRFLEK